MDLYAWFGVCMFVLAIVLIIFEHRLGVDKSYTVLIIGMISWILVFLQKGDEAHNFVKEPIAEIAEVVLFLFFAMTLVEVLEHYNTFDRVQYWIYKLNLRDGWQIWVVCLVTAFMSAGLDNLTTTIIMIRISKGFFSGKNFVICCCAIVSAANIGGAPSPIGDVTTLMLWVAQKFTAIEVIKYGTIPAAFMWFVSTLLFARKVKADTVDETPELKVSPTKSEILVIVLTLLSFPLPVLFVAAFHLPSFFGLALGLGVVGTVIGICRKNLHDHETHLTADIKRLVQKADISVLKFFVGILSAVAALEALGVLSYLGNLIFGQNPDATLVMTGNVALGLLSASLDNIPLVALAIDLVPSHDSQLWVLLALTAGTGGSILSFGSAAGVVAMETVDGMNRKGELSEKLNFMSYLKIATIPAFLSFAVGVLVFGIQYWLIN